MPQPGDDLAAQHAPVSVPDGLATLGRDRSEVRLDEEGSPGVASALVMIVRYGSPADTRQNDH